MVPADWPFAVRTGIESVLAGWLLVVVPTLAVFASTSSMDAAAALSAGTALRAGTGLWGLGLGGVWGSASSSDGAVGLPLLGLTILQALIIRWSVRRSRLARPLSGVWTVLTAMAIGAVIVVASGPAGSRMWTAVLGLGALTALIVFGALVGAPSAVGGSGSRPGARYSPRHGGSGRCRRPGCRRHGRRTRRTPS